MNVSEILVKKFGFNKKFEKSKVTNFRKILGRFWKHKYARMTICHPDVRKVAYTAPASQAVIFEHAACSYYIRVGACILQPMNEWFVKKKKNRTVFLT